MKFTATALTLSLIVSGASASKVDDIRANRHLTKSFLDAMHQPDIAAARKKGHAQRIHKLQASLMNASRKLQNDENYQYNQYNQYNYDGQEVADQIPFDMTSRSFKYSGCAAIKSYDEERAEENGNPIVMDTYSVFRLCPSDSCNDVSVNGCSRNYGEYAVEMKTYLNYVLDYYDNRYEEYCEYCLACDNDVQAEAKTYTQQCYYKQAQQQYQMQAQQQQQAQQDYYNANGAANANGYSAYNNGQGFSNYQQYYNGGGRKLEQNNGQYYANGGNYGEDVNEQNANAYGYYNENGEWVEGDGAAAQQQGYWGQDGNWYPYEDANALNYKCMDGTACDACTYETEQIYGVCDDYVCGDYYTYCSDLYNDGQQQDEAFDIRDFLECQAFENDYGQEYFIGPHCGSDGYTVSLGIFSDENCVNYVGETVTLSSVLGYNYDEEDLFKFPTTCISCDGVEEYVEEQDAAENEGRYGAYVTAPETTEDGIVAMCFALYDCSAQCNMNMDSYESMSLYMSSYELDLEKRYCTFIENIVNGAYDESGEIILQREDFDIADWKNPAQYKKLSMPAWQASALAGSIILCVALAATACFTARALSRQSTPWKPKRDALGLSRQNSGIVMGRSRSGPGAAPLI